MHMMHWKVNHSVIFRKWKVFSLPPADTGMTASPPWLRSSTSQMTRWVVHRVLYTNTLSECAGEVMSEWLVWKVEFCKALCLGQRSITFCNLFYYCLIKCLYLSILWQPLMGFRRLSSVSSHSCGLSTIFGWLIYLMNINFFSKPDKFPFQSVWSIQT